MKIGFDNDIFCLQRYGGISRYYVELAKELQNLGNQTKVFAGLYVNEYLESISDQVVGMKLSQSRKPKPIRKLIPKINHLVGTKLINCWQPDVIHQTYHFNPMSQSKPIVVTVHDMIHELFATDFHPNDKTSYCKKKSVDNAQAIIAISQSTKNDLIRLFDVPESKIHVVYHGFNNFQPINSNKQNIDSLMIKRPYLLYVGHRGGYKNFANFITAYAQAKLYTDFDIVAFGGGYWTNEEKLLINQLGLQESNIHQMSGNDDLLGQLYSNATVFVYPSKYEGFGIPPLEAMAHNCPVISSNTSSIPEVIGDAGVYFNPNDIDEMAQVLKMSVYDKALHENLIVKGHQRLNLFSWKKCAEQTQAVYQTLV